MVEIKVLPKPDLDYARMKCDKIIHPSLETYPMIEDCFSKTNFTLIIGSMGYGKTSLCLQFLKNIYNRCFHNIYVIMPSASRRSIKDDIISKYIDPENVFDDLTPEVLEYIHKQVDINSECDEFSYVLIDDFQSKLKDKKIEKALDQFVLSVRHLRTTIFLLAQNYQKVPKSIREKASNLIFFRLSKSQLEMIFEQVISNKHNVYDEIIQKSFIDKHDWICLNLNNSHKFYRGFDEIII